MQIIEKRIQDIKPYEKNPRKNDAAVKYVSASIKEFGFKVPIVIDKKGVIVCGHTRYKAALSLGIDFVPCIIADDLTEEQIKAFRLADNKVSEIAEWDDALLDLELGDIIDLDMSDFGFDKAVSGDAFGEDFELPSGEKSEFCQMTLTLHEKQKDFINGIIDKVKDEVSETFGNPNENGNAIYEVCKQWAEQKK